MPPAFSATRPAGHSVGRQAQHARHDIVERLFHLCLPWAAWIGLLVLALALKLAFTGLSVPWPVIITAGSGLGLAWLDHHLRSHRAAVLGRWIGPVTALAATGWLAAIVAAGFSRELLSAWLYLGVPACIGWDVWLAVGDHHDLSRAFIPAAEAAGIGGSRLVPVSRNKHVTRAKIQFPRGEVKTAEAAGRVEHLEGAMGFAPGSWALANDRTDAGVADVTITDPRLLDRNPILWPGPSAPGESVSVPFREGLWADGEQMLYDLLPLGHVRGMGCTGSGKTVSWAWNHMAEGMTRHDWACLAADYTKGEQFLGPLRPALHWLATEPDEVLELLAGVHRVVRARCDYLGKKRIIEWRPGCGLTFLDVWLEETPDIIALLDPSKTASAAGKVYLREWISDVRASRTAGVAWRQSYQRADHTQLPTIARGQMGHLCFGVMESKDAEFGLSELQRERGCRPQIWGANVPGKAVWDTLTIPQERKTLPMRFYSWGSDSNQIAAYASEWPASQRPLDDVTGEALEARTPRPASSAFPAPRRGNGNGNGHGNGNGNGNGARPTVPPGARLMPEYTSRISSEEALKKIRAQLAAWKAEGTQFTVRELANAVGEEVVCLRDCGDPSCTGRSRSWLYNQVTALTMAEVLAAAGGRPTRYEITGDPEGGTP
jgi:hypothetical protein